MQVPEESSVAQQPSGTGTAAPEAAPAEASTDLTEEARVVLDGKYVFVPDRCCSLALVSGAPIR